MTPAEKLALLSVLAFGGGLATFVDLVSGLRRSTRTHHDHQYPYLVGVGYVISGLASLGAYLLWQLAPAVALFAGWTLGHVLDAVYHRPTHNATIKWYSGGRH